MNNASPYVDNMRFGVYGVSSTSVPEERQPPHVQLMAAQPNPLRTSTRIGFSTPSDGYATLTVYDVAGRQVRKLVDATMPAGPHVVTWDARDDAGRHVATGLYFYRLTAGDYRASKKIVVVE